MANTMKNANIGRDEARQRRQMGYQEAAPVPVVLCVTASNSQPVRRLEPTELEIDNYRWAMQTVDCLHGFEPNEYSDAEVVAALLRPLGGCSGETALEESRRCRALLNKTTNG